MIVGLTCFGRPFLTLCQLYPMATESRFWVTAETVTGAMVTFGAKDRC